jgi:hypothetical protein
MTATNTDDIFARGAQWVPILLFHLGLYLQDPEAGWSVLEPGNPLFDLVPIDVLAAILIVFDSLAVMGEVTPDDLENLMKEFGSALAGTTTDTSQGSAE